jgi:hypothetical protein
MPRVCTVCRHSQREEIDHQLLGASPLRTIADQWSVSKTALIRHKAEHLASTLVKSKQAEQVAHADALVDQLKRLTADARRIQEKAERAEDYRAALAAVRELIRIIDLVARLSGDLQARTETNVLNLNVSPDTATRMAEIYLSRRKALEVQTP